MSRLLRGSVVYIETEKEGVRFHEFSIIIQMYCGISTACDQVAYHLMEQLVNCFQQNPQYCPEMLTKIKVDACFNMYDFKTGLPISRGKVSIYAIYATYAIYVLNLKFNISNS